MTPASLIGKSFVCLSVILFSINAYASTDLDKAIEEIANGLAFSRSGLVLKASKSEVYINIGQEDGIQPGNEFEIVKLGEPIMSGNEIIGYEEEMIAKARAEKVREKMTICKITAMFLLPSQGNKAYQVKKKILRLAVSQFPYSQQSNQLTEHLQQKISTALVQKGMQVVERGQLEKVLAEQKLGYSGLVNLDSAKKVGQLLGAEAIVLGSIGDLGDDLTVDARLVDLESGDSMAAVDSKITKTEQVARMLKKNTRRGNDSDGTSPPEPDGKEQTGKYPKAEKVGGFIFTPGDCRRLGETVNCTVTFYNEANEEVELQVLGSGYGYKNNAKMFDNKGNQYDRVRISLRGGREEGYIHQKFFPKLPVNISYTTREVPIDATHMTVAVGIKEFKSHITLRNIPISK